jgi:hypothetical protein
MRAWRPQNPLASNHLISWCREIQSRLAAAEQFEINGGKQPAIDFGPVLDTIR